MNLNDLFASSFRRSPEKVALSFVPERGETVELTYSQLLAASRGIAAGFADRGVRAGDRVALFAGNGPELVAAYLAVFQLGAVAVPVNLAYQRREIGHILRDATPRLVLTERDRLPTLDQVDSDARESVEGILVVEEIEGWRGDAEAAPTPAVGGHDLALIMYTSGTTGRSKGAMTSHDNVLATVSGLLEAWAWRADDRLLLSLPLFHVHGLVVGLTCALAAGATVRLRRRFVAAEIVADLDSWQATLFFGVPTMYVRLVEALRQRGEPRLGSMRLFCSGSAPLAPATFDSFQQLTGHTILERYGMTETGMNLSNLYDGPRVAGSVGVPLPGVSIRIVDEVLADVEIGSEGELLVGGENVFRGYWRAPEKSAESFHLDDRGERWFRTGDLARQDPDSGYVTLLGRRQELIISGGLNIYPKEIEETLVAFPGVREAAVVGRADAEWGEVPAAYLVTDGVLDEGELMAFFSTQLAPFKRPRTVSYVDALPRNALGKVQKHLLGASSGDAGRGRGPSADGDDA